MLLFPPHNVEQCDSLRGGHELVIITLVIIYQWKCNLGLHIVMDVEISGLWKQLNLFPFTWRDMLTWCSMFMNDVGCEERAIAMAADMAPGWQAHHTCSPVPSFQFVSFTRFSANVSS